jgi:hypothetical protein
LKAGIIESLFAALIRVCFRARYKTGTLMWPIRTALSGCPPLRAALPRWRIYWKAGDPAPLAHRTGKAGELSRASAGQRQNSSCNPKTNQCEPGAC